MHQASLFRGLSAFPLTPIDADGHLQADVLGALLARIRSAGADSIGLLGSTGAYAYLSRAQRRETVRVAVECVGGKVPIIVGVGALRTDEAQALARDAEAAGADGLLLAPVSYTPLTDEEVFQHFVAVTEASRLPLCVYNNPATTRFSFGEMLLARLAALPSVVAVKMPYPASGDVESDLASLRAALPDGFAIGYSGDWGAADALLAGCDAWFSVVAGLLPAEALALTRAAQAGDVATTDRIDAAFRPLWELFKAHGSFRVVHAMAGALGIATLAPPRPILPLGDGIRAELEVALDRVLTQVR
ncbi:dihydrodipicolinate synthase family protein [Salinarimonas rosea]|uniref:dihydrodipicolinate synthase family protein n=1 Tax=Salinarimonas rosea TaxID=552063 RepID=UPI0003FE5221|nr:dihydrodipicolinate synthase family protein [Salinarimonas rosea]